ncbi:MAG TPA: hypothetical protein VLV86_19850 [Vicinamibacterales bacterium]|nr:hypothetical protein [Vicinamibacterales bacterium]
MLAKKLNLKPGMRVAVANAPNGFSLGALPQGVTQEKSLKRDLDSVMLFAVSQKELSTMWPKALSSAKTEGAIWVAYPKKSSGIDSDLAGMQEWSVVSGSGWNPVAAIGIDDTWSAVRFKYAPGLETERHERQEQRIEDGDGMVCVDREARRDAAEGSAETPRQARQSPRRVRRAIVHQPQGICRLDSRRQEAGDERRTTGEDPGVVVEGEEESVR